MPDFLHKVWPVDEGQDIAEYAIMLAVILALGVGAVRALGVNVTGVFSSVGSSIQ